MVGVIAGEALGFGLELSATGAFAGAAEAVAAPSTTSRTCPGLTVSPDFTSSLVIFPATVLGSSTTALSVSSSIRIWPLVIVSPDFTAISAMSAEATPSPRLGSLNSTGPEDEAV